MSWLKLGHFRGHWREGLASQSPGTVELIFTYGQPDRKWTMPQLGTHGPQCHLSRERDRWGSIGSRLPSARRICSWTDHRGPTGEWGSLGSQPGTHAATARLTARQQASRRKIWGKKGRAHGKSYPPPENIGIFTLASSDSSRGTKGKHTVNHWWCVNALRYIVWRKRCVLWAELTLYKPPYCQYIALLPGEILSLSLFSKALTWGL